MLELPEQSTNNVARPWGRTNWVARGLHIWESMLIGLSHVTHIIAVSHTCLAVNN